MMSGWNTGWSWKGLKFFSKPYSAAELLGKVKDMVSHG
jgi:hypothetical protein